MESELTSLLICKICNNIYKNPVKLPCGNSICLNHVQSNYECELCDQIHPMPQNGFKENAELNMLLQVRNSQILQGLCKKMNELAQRAELIAKEPTFFINEYFSELRAMIDSERDKLIQKINEDHSRILEQINQNENKCLSNKDYNQSVLNKAIKSSKDELNKWQSSNFNSFLSDTKSWHNLKSLRELEIVKLKHALDEFQKELLFYKKFSFETKDENTFGVLTILDDLKSNNDKLKETINFEIKKFKSFVSDKLDWYYDKYLALNQIPWRILFKIEKNSDEDSNLFLCAYFMPEYDKELPNINKINLTFKLIDLDGKIFSRIEYSYFGSNLSNRSVVCSINDLMNSSSKVYNTEIDSINLEINIEVETIEIIISDFLLGCEHKQLNATRAFQNLTKNQLDSALKAGIVPKLVKLLQEDNNELKLEAARVLTKITSSDLLETSGMIEANDLALLVKSLNSSCEDVQEEAVSILSNIAGGGCEYRDRLFDHGILSPLLEILSKDKLMLKRKAAWCMFNLFSNNVRPVDITRVELALPILSDQLWCTDKEVLVNLCYAVFFLTSGDDSFRNIQKIMDAGMFPRLVGLLLFDSSDVVQVVLDIVTNIVIYINSHRQAILSSKLLGNLCMLLSSTYEPIRKAVIQIISSIIAQNTERIQAAFDANIFSKLIEILNESSNVIKKETVSILRDTTINGTELQIRHLINLNIISSLCNLFTRENCNEIVELSLECLINMIIKVCCSDTREYQIKIKNCNGLEKIYSLMEINGLDQNVFKKAFQLIQMYYQYLA